MDLSAQSSNTFWQGQSIYQIITDRFYDGNTANDNVEGTYAPSNPTGVHGGDFAGLEQKLDYIKSLGATAIWISPIVLNTEGQYHGYSAMNFYEVAPHWGSITDLQNLVQAAHARGLKVIDDIVVNHAGDLVTGSGLGYPTYSYPAGYTLKYVNNGKTYPAPFNLTTANPSLTNLWHNYGNIDSYNNSQEVVLGWLDGLNDFRTETTYVRTNMIDIYEYWINQIGFDAYRVDSVLEVDHGCWQTFCPAIYAFTATNIPTGATSPNTNFFMFCEADNGSESTVGPYTGNEDGGPYEFESTEDYPLYYDLNSVFATLSGNTEQIQNHYNLLKTYYDPTTLAQQVIFLDNQDNPRFLSSSESNNNTNALKEALVFLYTSVGIPCLYYGTEQGFDGTTDPDCREDMFAGKWKDGGGTVESLSSPGVDNFNMTHPLFQWVARLNNFRRLYPAMSLGSYVNQWSNSSGPGLFAYSRILNTQEVFAVFNTASSSQTLPARTLTYPAGTVIVNLLNTNETYTLGTGSQTPAISVPGVTAKIFIAQSQWQPLNPVVVSNSPAHWTSKVPTYTPIVLQFSGTMDTNSVQSAFSTSPAVTGAFSWSSIVSSNDTLTFTPTGAGYPALTNITVTVTNTAFDAVYGNTLFAPYSLTFGSAAAVGPLVSITTPTNNEDVIPGSNLIITVNATEYGSGTLANVAFYANSTFLGNSSSAPYSFTWANTPGGSYALTAVASDSQGNSITSSVVNISAGPSVSITSPANNTGFNPGSSITITAAASETGATITNVAFYANATLLGNSAGAPFSFTYSNVPAGAFALTASASDSFGNATTSSVVNITLGPAVSITAPATGANFKPGSSIAISASASENGGTITNVAFYANTRLLGNSPGAPYGYNWTNAAFGDDTLTAVASDSSGYTATSGPVYITVTPSLAFDAESNYSTWTSGQNEGYGFAPWVLVSAGEYTGFILNPSGSIDTSGDSWAMYANGTGTPYAYAYRGFSSSLAAGEVFSVQFANPTVTSPGSMGFCLRNSNSTTTGGSTTPPAPIVTNTATRFAFYLVGGQSDYSIWDSKGANNTGIPYTTSGLTLQFTLLTADTYQLTVLSGDGSTLLTNWSGTLAGTSGSAIQMFTAFDVDTGSYQNAYFNTLRISAAAPVVISNFAGNNSSIFWASTPGANYMVLATTNLGQAFTPASGVIQATGYSTSYTDVSNSPPVVEKFYEIEVAP